MLKNQRFDVLACFFLGIVGGLITGMSAISLYLNYQTNTSMFCLCTGVIIITFSTICAAMLTDRD